MSGRPSRSHSPAATANVALTAIQGEKTLAELAEQVDVQADQIASWRVQLLEGAAEVFGGDSKAEAPRTHGCEGAPHQDRHGQNGPAPNGIMTVHDPASGQQIFDPAQAGRTVNGQPDRLCDDFAGKAVTARAGLSERAHRTGRPRTTDEPVNVTVPSCFVCRQSRGVTAAADQEW